MKCINFDKQFEKFAASWMRQNAEKYGHNIDRMEEKIPDVYLQWLNRPADWLDGLSPGGFFTQFSDAQMLADWMLSYAESSVPIPDQLMEQLTRLGEEGERALLALLNHDHTPEEVRLLCISLLSEMESKSPMAKYITWIAERQEADERADLAAEALAAMGRGIVAPVLEAISRATKAGKETFIDVLCNYPGDEAIYGHALSMFKEEAEKRALYASLLGKLGDERAIPELVHAMEDPAINYLDYIELRNAIEALGGEVRDTREFAGDPYYESLWRME